MARIYYSYNVYKNNPKATETSRKLGALKAGGWVFPLLAGAGVIVGTDNDVLGILVGVGVALLLIWWGISLRKKLDVLIKETPKETNRIIMPQTTEYPTLGFQDTTTRIEPYYKPIVDNSVLGSSGKSENGIGYCRFCGERIPSNSVFCQFCGERLRD